MSTVAGRRIARRTRTKPIISYAESSSTENELDLDSTDDLDFDENQDLQRRSDHDIAPQLQTVCRSRRDLIKRPRLDAHRRANSHVYERRPMSKKRRHVSGPELTSSKNHSAIKPTSEVIPPWQSLPYHVFVQIFTFASYPLYDENTFQPLVSGRWLLSVARMCRAFAEPALTVLYSSPPLVPMVKAHMLVDLLKRDPTSLAFKYRQKVVSLQIEVSQVAEYILRGSGYIDLFSLVRDLPRLLDLEFYHQKDMMPYRDLDATIKWTYPDSIFNALELIDPDADHQRGDKTMICRLRSWRWSSRLAGKRWPLEKIIQVHMKPSFRSLRKIAFVNYQVPSLKEDEEDPNYEKILAEALNILPNLEYLIFESSTLLNSNLLPLLPKNLLYLELINCWELTSDDLAEFLITHGQRLRNLTLNHNQSLNLAFLTILGHACPGLEIFRMNMMYFNIHSSYRDSEPLYDHLLLPGQVPVWPKKIQTIELTQLRKWETKAAEMFFSSLLDSAADMPDLRRLSIQAILNVGWRDRASFRDRWVGSLNKVFKRSSEPPTSAYTLLPSALRRSSLSTLRTSSSCSDTQPFKSSEYQVVLNENFPRRSRRTIVRAIPCGRYVESSTPEDSESEKTQGKVEKKLPHADRMRRRLTRELNILRDTGGIDLNTFISSSSETLQSCHLSYPPIDDSRYPTSDGVKSCQFIQGMCESVEVRIDNLRPVENQVTEADFLDDEVSGDEDWNSEGDEGQWAFEGIINHV
ncbi:hypothetical protein GcM3_084002 [Golovinomyces cichoracearum]|uniref:Uncharacterized protein n=1 Tax=Golovinomyces cichoracearum TaxID=62708 RepID=A0A420ILQ7_9PEZI|nr:hypothetical protein GcM3_084002 [Golovinomyces cichoracearum]